MSSLVDTLYAAGAGFAGLANIAARGRCTFNKLRVLLDNNIFFACHLCFTFKTKIRLFQNETVFTLGM